MLKRSAPSPLQYYRIELHLMFRVCTTALGAVEHMFFQSRVPSEVEEKKSSVFKCYVWLYGLCVLDRNMPMSLGTHFPSAVSL